MIFSFRLIRPFPCALRYWIICVGYFRLSRAFAILLGSYLERAAFFPAIEATRLRPAADYSVVVRATRYFGASEFTIFSKRGSPRKGSHIGLKRKLP